MLTITITKRLYSLSNRDLWTALWLERRRRSNGPRLDELHAEWWRRIEDLRGKPRRKGWSARGLQRAELFRRATEAYFDGMEDAVALTGMVVE
jgi:hypothetical protein